MRIALITPYGPEYQNGNWHTAARWATFLREAGHRVDIATAWNGLPADVMIALHARRSASAIHAFTAKHPDRPLIVVLTGTDLYRDIRHDPDAQQSLELAHRLVVLQEKGVEEMAPELAAKTRVIYQSAPDIPRQPPSQDHFEVLVIGHLREEKDPYRTALAAALLPEHSRIRITHLGRALSTEMEEEAKLLQSQIPRWRWLGEMPHEAVIDRLSRAHLMVVSSRMEGGANVICEALAAGVPVIASDIPGNIGMLGDTYPGYYPVGDEQGLAQLLSRAESDGDFYAGLASLCHARRVLMTPEREATSVRQLVVEFETRPVC
ncbi:MAG: TIGR04348 family glycosyltransferase [Hydrogenophilaceae bacterium]|nr:TIGR04348 family glycosyltransferase [Hydrogenophilaceae bacterium]